MILLIDNYDSFTYNVAQLLVELGADVRVVRNDAITVEEAFALRPTHLVISPGPGTPAEAGISRNLIRRFAPTVPILGICLGHQCIGEIYGASIVRAARPMHGKVSHIYHDGRSIYRGLPNPFEATRYHSLIVDLKKKAHGDLRVSAYTSDGEVMGIRLVDKAVEGVQFHPESVMTTIGKRMIANFLQMRGEA